MMAQSILDDAWEQGMSKDDAISLAQRAIEAAVQRDAGSGSGFYLAVIDDDGFQVVKDTETTPSITE